MTFIDLNFEASVNTLKSTHPELKCDTNLDEMYDKTLLMAMGNTLIDKFGCTVPFVPLSKRFSKRKANFLLKRGQGNVLKLSMR